MGLNQCHDAVIQTLVAIHTGDGERYSFDSDGFDEESICSWISEPESLCNVWRGWTWKNSSKPTISHNSTVKGIFCVTAELILID